MVQMNLFPGQEQRCRRGEQTCGPGRGQEWEGGTKWQVGTDIYATMRKAGASGDLLYSLGSTAKCSGMTWKGWMDGRDGPRGRGYNTYSWLISLYSRN